MIENYIKEILNRYELPDSESAVKLLAMIAAHESQGFRYVQQLKGTARGFFQMEQVALIDVINFLKKRKDNYEKAYQLLPINLSELNYHTEKAIVMARIYLLTKAEPLPNQLEDLADYAKTYWNTEKGKATAQKYLNDYKRYVSHDELV